MLSIEGAVAVITGGGSGIGETMAKYWVQHCGRVVLSDVSSESLERVDCAIRAMGGEVATMVGDVTKEEDCAALASLAMETFGAINLVVPCAGIINDGLFLSTDRETGKVSGKMSLAQFQKVIDINLTGVFLTVRECTEQMINNNCKIGHRGSTQLLVDQSCHVGDAQSHYRGIFQEENCP
jgi:3-oxoacyl-[acyl-carrier protein] reductase